MPERIAIFGAGNVAHFLAQKLALAGNEAKYIITRNRNKGLSLTDTVSPKSVVIDQLSLQHYDFNFLIICISDSAISEILKEMTLPANCVTVHTSGGIGHDVFSDKTQNSGVLYPFQTFTKSRDITSIDFPIFIEGSNEDSYEKITKVARLLSTNVKRLNSEQRAKLHVAGVFVNNFTNHLIAKSFDFLKSNNIDPLDLLPLINETTAKLFDLSPYEAQTGPAIRYDHATIKKHLDILSQSGNMELLSIYKSLSQSIQNTAK